MSFAKKIVIVTGASSGIGAATAISFAKEGANVVIVGRKELKLKKVTETCVATGNEPLLIKADISNEDEARRIIKETIDKFGQIDILVNNAAIIAFGGIRTDNILTVYDSVMNTNLRALIHLTYLATPYLIKTKGNIINISSVVGKKIYADYPMTCYGISKAGLDYFTRTVAVELAPHGVRVNTISPGPVKTDLLANIGLDISVEDEAKNVPLGRVSEPEEIADLILFLASDKAKAITGSDYITDNGSLLK